MKCAASNETLKERIKDEERLNAIKVIMTAVVVTALDKCRLCPSTVEKLINGAVDKADSINKGYITLDDLTFLLKKEYDFEIKFKEGTK